ncbi:hypothetical protein GCM10010218_65300 [Streptomyces mashuensis]|uniref:Uncharacterized protein n=1 Tax=Streptomyces mashuensis TaxID=33904 RepID=A0A919EGV2_9ACTN|nr:hypothetical protein [Streptomyces mashuensis]GHF75218.1 hypothetical protein GCM10010218_65300 [Streptomyces mashuensis]
MPLHVPPAPAPALRSIRTALGSPTAVREDRTPSLRSARTPLTAGDPLPVHVLEQAGARGTAARTRLTGWRFLIKDGDRAVAAGEAMPTPDGWAFSHFFEGPYLASTERALAQAEALPTPYQPRLLSVPGLYMLTLWLHADITADAAFELFAPGDVLIPLAPAPPGIAAHRPHRAADLLPLLTPRLSPGARLQATA